MTRTILHEGALHGDEAVTFVAGIAKLDMLLEAANNVVYGALDPPVPGKPVDLANKAGRRDPYEQARLLLAASEDHLRTVLILLQNNVLPMFSPFSLLRPAAEADVRIAYLVDPAIDEMQRLARGLNVRLESLVEQNKVRPDVQLLAQRVQTLTDKAVANGIIVRPSTKAGRGLVDSYGEPRRSEVELFGSYMTEGETMYRFLSAHVHSMPWVMLDADKATPTEDPDIAQVPLELDTKIFVGVLATVLAVHDKVIGDLMRLAGYPPLIWTKAKETSKANARSRYMKLLQRGDATTPTS